MSIFPVFDSILLPLAPTIAGAIADYWQLMAQVASGHLSQNCDDVDAQLSPDAIDRWQLGKSLKLDPTSQYQYVSPIAHRLAAKSSLTPLKICQKLQSPTLSPKIDVNSRLELSCWYNDAGYIYFQIAPRSIALWLEYLQNLPLTVELVGERCSTSDAVPPRLAIAIYAHARCCSVLTLAATEQIIQVAANWQTIPLQRSSDSERGIYQVNSGIAEWTSIFDHPAEQRSIHALMAVLDALSSHHLPLVDPCGLSKIGISIRWRDAEGKAPPMRSVSNRRLSSTESPNWQKLTIELAQSWLEFYRYCRIFGDVHSHNPHLAIARCGLTAIVRRYLQVLLEHHLGVSAAIEL
ncbi:hypothetical protein [Chamaesiphon sp.]|uniref:hypothetical protein n=1 Tax=Chamaesiphon sp. TaxID=2814140 RepID=UPI0035940E86